MNINWKTRIKHPAFWIGAVSSVLTPVLAYMGLHIQDVNTWSEVAEILRHMISNPYTLILAVGSLLSFLGVTVDHTTAGIVDSSRAMGYEAPNKE